MINLLPYETKRQTRAARMNVILIRYVVILGFALGFLAIACGATYFFLGNVKSPNEESAEKSTSASTAQVQAQADTFRANLVTVKSVLDQQISYSDIITGIGAILPKGAVIDSLTLTDTSFGTPMELKVFVTSADIEPRIKDSFKDSPLFSNYNLVATAATGGSSSTYPTTLTIGITINKGATK